MEIDEIFRKEKINVRLYNVCKYNNLYSIEDLQDYYDKHKFFNNLKKCGPKSNMELIEFLNVYQREHQEALNRKPLNIIISELTSLQREAINSFIIVTTNNLSIRSNRAITLYLNGNLNIENFAEKIFLSDSFILRNLKRVGAKCALELEVYIPIIKNFLLEVNQMEDDKHLVSLKNSFLIHHTFSISETPGEILKSESIFLLTNFLLDQHKLYNKPQTNIFKKCLRIYQNQKELTLDDIAEEVKLTKERIRQIRKTCLDGLLKNLLFIQNFNEDLSTKYNIDITSNQIEINREVANLINTTNKTNLSKEFITYIVYAYLYDSFVLIGNIEDVLQINTFNSRHRHNWNDFYLIKNKIAAEFDFNALANDIENRINDRIEKSYSLDLKNYVSGFLTNNNIEFFTLAFPIIEKIISNEFAQSINFGEQITFKRNTLKKVSEYSYEALEILGKESKVIDVLNKVKELYPNYDIEESGIRSSMTRANGFIPVGRQGIFGLRKWEDEFDFRGGTIKEVIIKFLNDKKEPAHIQEVINHLKKYCGSKGPRTVITNLRVDKMKRFVIYSLGFIGLESKKSKYSNKYENLPVHLGKTIVGKYKKGASREDLTRFISNTYNLSSKEAGFILDSLKYLNDHKRN